MVLIGSVLCIVLGVMAIRNPKAFWGLETFLWIKGGEPTRLYLLAMRIIGVLAVCAGAAAILLTQFQW